MVKLPSRGRYVFPYALLMPGVVSTTPYDRRNNLNAVTNSLHTAVKNRLLKKLAEEEGKAGATSTPATGADIKK